MKTNRLIRGILLPAFLLIASIGSIAIVTAQDLYGADPSDVAVSTETTRINDLSTLTNSGGRPEPALTTLPALERDRRDKSLTPFGNTYTRLVNVSNSDELKNALQNAQPGDYIKLENGVYQGEFIADRSGGLTTPIVLHGSRDAILEAQPNTRGYGFYLNANYWVLSGFTIRNAAKGVMADEANNNVISGLHIYNIGDEGIHLRRNSSNNVVQYNWIQDTGLRVAEFGEGIYVGSAISNWETLTAGQPDKSDNNHIISNLLGPGISAEGIDIKEGTTGGLVRNNTFISDSNKVGDSWIDTKGNNYLVSGNSGIRPTEDSYNAPYPVFQITPDWGQDNTVEDNEDLIFDGILKQPFRVIHATSSSSNIILPERPLRYTIAEIITRFPLAFEQMGRSTFLLKEHIVVGQGASLSITDLDGLYLLSSENNLTSITGQEAEITFESVTTDPLFIQSWQPDGNPSTDEVRAYIALRGGEMNASNTVFSYLGFNADMFSGVAWMGYVPDLTQDPTIRVTGTITDSQFHHNYYGAYTWEAEDMTWRNNVFAENLSYGFNGSDYSVRFDFNANTAQDNGNHGILFSRGSTEHTISNNQSLRNDGNGIMLDNGQLFGEGLTRYEQTAQSTHNTLNNNTIVDNVDGIVLEGSSDNSMQYNHISGLHRYGVRLNDHSNNNLVELNRIDGVERHNIYVYENSNDNRVLNNNLTGGRSGLAVDTSDNTQFESNLIRDVRGVAIILQNDITEATINNNWLHGAGNDVIRLENNDNFDPETMIEGNNTNEWKFAPPAILAYPTLFTWLFIFGIPVVMKLIVMIRHRLGYRYEFKP